MSEQTKTTKKTIALQNFDNSISSLVEGSSNNDSLLKEEKNEQKIEIQRISSSLEESPKQIKSKIYNLAVTKSQDQVEPETPSSPSKNSPTLKKMFGVLGNFGNGLKKNLTSIRSKSRSSMAINLKKIQEKLNFLRAKNTDILTEKERKVLLMKKNIRRTDTIASLLAILNAGLCYYENELFFAVKTDPENSDIIIKNKNESDASCTALRVIIMLLTLSLLGCVYLHYYLTLKKLKIKQLRVEEDTIYTSGLFPRLLLELFVCSICCPPYLDYEFEGKQLDGKYSYSYDAIFNVITLFKSYLLIRLFQHYSPWTKEKAIKACKKAKCQAGFSFALKCELKKRPYVMIGILILATVIYLGLAMRTFEISYFPNKISANAFDFSYLANSMWLIIITMTTVGFGEGYPTTHLGRFIGVIACVIGMLLVSLMVVSLTVSSEFTPEESKAYYFLKKIYAVDNSKEKAANVIKSLFQLREIIKCKDAKSLSQRFVWIAKLKKNINLFKNDYKLAGSNNIPLDEMLINLQDKLKNNISEIKKEMSNSNVVEKKCLELKVCQKSISERLGNISKMQNIIADYVISLDSFLDKQL